MISLGNIHLKQQISIKNLRRLSDKPLSGKLDPPKIGGLASKLGTTLDPNSATASPASKPKWNDKPQVGGLNSDNSNKFSSTASSPFSRNTPDSNQPSTSQPSKFKFTTKDTASKNLADFNNTTSQPSKFTFPKKDAATISTGTSNCTCGALKYLNVYLDDVYICICTHVYSHIQILM
jgi:hypothetical protein